MSQRRVTTFSHFKQGFHGRHPQARYSLNINALYNKIDNSTKNPQFFVTPLLPFVLSQLGNRVNVLQLAEASLRETERSVVLV